MISYFKFYRQILKLEGVVFMFGMMMMFISVFGFVGFITLYGILGFLLMLAIIVFVFMPFGAWLVKNMFTSYEYEDWRDNGN